MGVGGVGGRRVWKGWEECCSRVCARLGRWRVMAGRSVALGSAAKGRAGEEGEGASVAGRGGAGWNGTGCGGEGWEGVG